MIMRSPTPASDAEVTCFATASVGAIGEPFAGCAVVAGTAYLAIHGPQVPRFAVLIGCGGSLMFTLSTSSVAGFVT
jgi:hypothetical protein